VNFGHPPPLVYSAEFGKFVELDKSRMVQFLPLGLQISEDHPDRNRYLSLDYRKPRVKSSDVTEITLMNTGDIFFLYTDGVYSGGDREERSRLEK
jgi:Stage II sporulation protein E (SpoIIE)